MVTVIVAVIAILTVNATVTTAAAVTAPPTHAHASARALVPALDFFPSPASEWHCGTEGVILVRGGGYS